MILALMPLGVEHSEEERAEYLAKKAVILALMPLGVEHSRDRYRSARARRRVILALMPLGVEHCRTQRIFTMRQERDPRIDAVRR